MRESSEERARDGSAKLARTAAPAGSPVTAQAQTLTLQRQVGNRATTRILQRKPKDLPAAIAATYEAWLQHYSKLMKLPPEHAKVDAAAEKATEKQVGSANWKKWKGEGVSIGPVEYKSTADEQREKAPTAEQLTPRGVYNGAATQMTKMSALATKLNAGVVEAEYFAQKLASPDGIKGFLYQFAVGGYGAIFGVGAAAIHYAKEKVNPVGQATEKALGIKSPTIEEKGAELTETAVMTYEVASGKLNDYYKQTRLPYNMFQGALKAFHTSRDAFNRTDYLHIGDWVPHMSQARLALGLMAKYAKEYQDVCFKLGIRQKAAQVDKLGKAIEAGMVNAVEFGLDAMAGGLMGSGDDAAKAAVKKGAGAAKPAVTETAEQAAKRGAQEADRAAKAAAEAVKPAVKDQVKDYVKEAAGSVPMEGYKGGIKKTQQEMDEEERKRKEAEEKARQAAGG
jgi:hypothetical protein